MLGHLEDPVKEVFENSSWKFYSFEFDLYQVSNVDDIPIM